MLTLGVGADEGGEVSQEGEGGEVGEVSDLQGVQEGAEALRTESGGRARQDRGNQKQTEPTTPPLWLEHVVMPVSPDGWTLHWGRDWGCFGHLCVPTLFDCTMALTKQ